jgi:F420-non-reducing hydrogenase iron-sulfur subunit
MTMVFGGPDPVANSDEASAFSGCSADSICDANEAVRTYGPSGRQESFEPKIIAILCNWCTYSAADAAGSSHSVYPPNIQIVRVMCSGRVDPSLVLEALKRGIDGILICGCHPGDCHYINGNYKTAFRIPMLKRMIAQLGIEPERVRLEWISAAEASRFVQVAKEMTEQIRALGPAQRTVR